MRLSGKVALITGAGQGIGRATALLFGQQGAKVAVADINEEAATKTANDIVAAGGDAKAFTVNVGQAASVEAMVRAVVEWAGKIDVLVNNAGITRDARMIKMTEEQFDAVINVNLKGVWLCTKYVAPIMIENGGGSIINAASIVAFNGNFGQTNYVASKAGVIGMTKTWAREFGPSGIRVNAVAPGFTQTEMIAHVPEKVLDEFKNRTPLRRLGTAEDMAYAYLFLASDESSFITGEVLPVDGGLDL
jgi:3-oxoacyl-[acyl-carrier protein] reductase